MIILEVERIREDGEKITYYVDNWLYAACERIKKSIHGKDNDAVFVIDGPERSGKSVLAQQIAKTIDPTFCLSRMCLTPSQFQEAVTNASKGQVVVFDEAYTGLSSANALGSINKLLKELMMEMGQKNLVVLIVLPTIYVLERYVAIFRSKGLFHVYKKKINGVAQRGRWMFFPPSKVKLLYLYGKKELSYSRSTHHRIPGSSRKGKFYDQYTLVESSYRSKKADSLRYKDNSVRDNDFMSQRNLLLAGIYKDFISSYRDLSYFCSKCGFKLSKTQINDIIRELNIVVSD